jgi:hypothetical protein
MDLPRQNSLRPVLCVIGSLLCFACAGADPGGKAVSGTVVTTGGTLSASGGENPSGGTPIADGGASSSTDCPTGSERCACYGNSTCNPGLVCASRLCVDLSGLGGVGGTSATGAGGTEAGGSASGGIGGTPTSGSTSGGFPSGGNGAGGSSTGFAFGGAKATGGAGIGGAKATGGAATGGAATGGAATGGAATGGAATGGAATGGSSFWKTVTYNSTGLPNPSNGNHNAGMNCRQCHDGSTDAPVWLFGGTVYQANGTTPAPNVQVGVNDGTNLYTAYSATNGNFWVAGSGNLNWATAQVRVRNAKGELSMSGATPAATCNLCHNSTTDPRITAP